MKTPRYTDLARYPNGYRRSVETDITRTFDRALRKDKPRAPVVATIQPKERKHG